MGTDVYHLLHDIALQALQGAKDEGGTYEENSRISDALKCLQGEDVIRYSDCVTSIDCMNYTLIVHSPPEKVPTGQYGWQDLLVMEADAVRDILIEENRKYFLNPDQSRVAYIQLLHQIYNRKLRAIDCKDKPDGL